MSDKMRPIPFGELMDWVLREYSENNTIFGVYDIYKHTEDKYLPIFEERIETPFGPAAGPHSQLAQNIVAAYAGGSRFFELKTVQIIDGEDLPVSKPCILAEDEAYNCEWSTELYVPEAYDEYVKAWYALKLLSVELGLGAQDGFVFNMSVGYDLEGIKSAKIDKYLNEMKEAKDTEIYKECEAWTLENLSRFSKIDKSYVGEIDSKVCKSITISTLHGCPPDEIERIATYLIKEKNLHTYIKCNPTLLGYEYARNTMDTMGYDYLVFDSHHFEADLQFEDAIPMFRRLVELAGSKNLDFGLKLTNTFPVTVACGELPSEEMYMSGKSLYPLAINLAKKVLTKFDGKLRISYSGGIDLFNCEEVFNAGIWPITMATNLLKVGGYNRLLPMAEAIVKQEYKPFTGVDMISLADICERALEDKHHVKPIKPRINVKMDKNVPLVDCFAAPCMNGCPINQDVPTYVELVGQGKYDKALEVICDKNPLPFITGTICNHRCMTSCTRNHYEESVAIRDAKLEAANKGYDSLINGLEAKSERKENIAIVGGGPAGMAAAYLAAKAGSRATIFEKTYSLGGIVRHIIPEFRISTDAIDNDARLLDKLGIEVRFGQEVTNIEDLYKDGFTHVIIAVGAWKKGNLRLKSGEAMNVIDFLANMKADESRMELGENVVVIGGGNTAMDAARVAKRANGVVNSMIVYRRTAKEMPADEEELTLALDDGVEFKNLLAPISYDGSILTCEVMKLGERATDGRRSPEPTGEMIEIKTDTLIAAVGEKVDDEYLKSVGIAVNDRGRADRVDISDKLFIIGDAYRGPATVVEGIADATKAINSILGISNTSIAPSRDEDELRKLRANLADYESVSTEINRCLSCAELCENCVDVCPNRANVSVKVVGHKMNQIVHVDKMCNECGNCEVFCPYSSAPYKDKFTLFANLEDFKDSTNAGFLFLENNRVLIRLEGKEFEDDINSLTIDRGLVDIMDSIKAKYSYYI